MNSHPKLFSFLVFVGSTVGVTFVVFRLAGTIAGATGSGFGICGPYGDHPGLVAGLIFASFPLGIAVGVVSSRRLYRRLTSEPRRAWPK